MMGRQYEFSVNAPEGTTIIRADIVDGGKSVKILTSKTESFSKMELERNFPIVRVSELSTDDKWFQHVPKTQAQKRLKKSLEEIINSKMPDFRHSAIDPAEDSNGNVIFEYGKMPAVEHSANWWDAKAKLVMPSKNSRLGTEKQYDAFLGVLIKYLVEEEGYFINKAWKMVCNNSRNLGHYLNSADAKFEFEPTGSRKVGKWYDLANISKIVKSSKGDGFFLVSGDYYAKDYQYPLADIFAMPNPDKKIYLAVGWIVLDL